MSAPLVLDPACGGRMFYFDKSDDRVLFGDIRELDETVLTNGQRFEVRPDEVMDFRSLSGIENDSFYAVVFDPPHSTRAGKTGWLATKYGSLDKDAWREDLTAGFAECFRVLRPGGVLVFKWNETDITLSQVLMCTPEKPLIGHRSSKRMQTHWVMFVKATP